MSPFAITKSCLNRATLSAFVSFFYYRLHSFVRFRKLFFVRFSPPTTFDRDSLVFVCAFAVPNRLAPMPKCKWISSNFGVKQFIIIEKLSLCVCLLPPCWGRRLYFAISYETMHFDVKNWGRSWKVQVYGIRRRGVCAVRSWFELGLFSELIWYERESGHGGNIRRQCQVRRKIPEIDKWFSPWTSEKLKCQFGNKLKSLRLTWLPNWSQSITDPN